MMRGLSFTLQSGEGLRRHVGGQLRKPSAFRLPILTNSETRPVKNLLTYALVFGLGVAATFFYLHHTSSSGGHGGGHHSQAMSSSGHITHGGGLHEHDEINMPGLQGKDTTDQEVNDLKEIFRSHEGISRSVSNLQNGIVTTTEATDEILREAIVSHVSMMVTRLQEGRNPDVIIQSPTLDALFDVYDEIDTEIETTELGVKVIQTSSNPKVVGLLQQHAAEVSDMASRGMEAVHERMAGQSP